MACFGDCARVKKTEKAGRWQTFQKIFGRIPCPSLIAFIMCVVGIVIFTGCLYAALEYIVMRFNIYILRKVLWLVLAFHVLLASFFLLVATMSTGSTRREVCKRCTGCSGNVVGRCFQAMVISSAYFFHLIWLIIPAVLLLPVVILTAFVVICQFVPDCIKLSDYGIDPDSLGQFRPENVINSIKNIDEAQIEKMVLQASDVLEKVATDVEKSGIHEQIFDQIEGYIPTDAQAEALIQKALKHLDKDKIKQVISDISGHIDKLDIKELTKHLPDISKIGNRTAQLTALRKALVNATRKAGSDASSAIDKGVSKGEEWVESVQNKSDAMINKIKPTSMEQRAINGQRTKRERHSRDNLDQARDITNVTTHAETMAKSTKQNAEEMTKSKGKKAAEDLKSQTTETAGDIKATGERAAKDVQDTAKKTAKDTEKTATKMTKEIEESGKKAGKEIEKTAKEAAKTVESTARETAGKMQQLGNNTHTELRETAEASMNEARKTVDKTKVEIERLATETKEKVEDVANEARHRIERISKDLHEKAYELAGDAQDLANKGMDEVVDLAKQAAKDAKKAAEIAAKEAELAMKKAEQAMKVVSMEVEATAKKVAKEAEKKAKEAAVLAKQAAKEAARKAKEAVDNVDEVLRAATRGALAWAREAAKKARVATRQAISGAKFAAKEARKNSKQIAKVINMAKNEVVKVYHSFLMLAQQFGIQQKGDGVYCSEAKKIFCVEVKKAHYNMIFVFIASILINLSMVHFLMAMSANYVRVVQEAKRKGTEPDVMEMFKAPEETKKLVFQLTRSGSFVSHDEA